VDVLIDVLIIAICIVGLAKGATWLVDSSVKIARRLGISELVVGPQTNSGIAGGVEFTNHETFNPDKHLIIAAGVINDPWFIDTTDPNPKIYNTVPSGEDGLRNV
jgi:hypothetical protein